MKLNLFKIRVIIISVLLSLSGYLAVSSFYGEHLWLTRISLIVVWGLLLYLLIRYVTRTNRKLKSFLESLRFTDNMTETSQGDRSFRELDLTYNLIIDTIKKAHREKEAQRHFFRNTLEHVSIGLFSYNETGEVLLVNQACRELLGIPVLRNISDLDRAGKNLHEVVDRMEMESNRLLSLVAGDELRRISIKKTGLKIMGEHICIISLQDIRSELEEEELETWQKLISILRHEIMNSVAPVRSLTGSLQRITEKIEREIPADAAGSLKEGLDAIAKRTEGMMSFVQAYRTLTNIPKPDFTEFDLIDLLKEQALLFREENPDCTLLIEESGQEKVKLTADYNLVSQVMINLLHNAIQSVENQEGHIRIRYGTDKDKRIFIKVGDNGRGMGREELEKIFIPFYTTREEGTGIGLSLSRQIMRIHKGTISVSSEPGRGSEFTLRF